MIPGIDAVIEKSDGRLITLEFDVNAYISKSVHYQRRY